VEEFILTAEHLRNRRACAPQVELYQREFPDGLRFAPDVNWSHMLAAVKAVDLDWVWFYYEVTTSIPEAEPTSRDGAVQFFRHLCLHPEMVHRWALPAQEADSAEESGG
jgi:hypothetical protein